MIQNIQYNTRWMRLCSRVFIILLFLELASCGDDISKNTRDSPAGSVISSIDSMEQLNKIIETSKDRLLMFDFYADWCAPCRELDEVTFRDREVVKQAAQNIVMIKVDLTRKGNPDHERLLQKYEVKGVPTVVFLDRQGIERRDLRLVDFLPADQILVRMAEIKKQDSSK